MLFRLDDLPLARELIYKMGLGVRHVHLCPHQTSFEVIAKDAHTERSGYVAPRAYTLPRGADLVWNPLVTPGWAGLNVSGLGLLAHGGAASATRLNRMERLAYKKPWNVTEDMADQLLARLQPLYPDMVMVGPPDNEHRYPNGVRLMESAASMWISLYGKHQGVPSCNVALRIGEVPKRHCGTIDHLLEWFQANDRDYLSAEDILLHSPPTRSDAAYVPAIHLMGTL